MRCPAMLAVSCPAFCKARVSRSPSSLARSDPIDNNEDKAAPLINCHVCLSTLWVSPPGSQQKTSSFSDILTNTTLRILPKPKSFNGSITDDNKYLLKHDINIATLFKKGDSVYEPYAELTHQEELLGAAFINNDKLVVTWDGLETKVWGIGTTKELTAKPISLTGQVKAVSSDKSLFALQKSYESKIDIWNSDDLTIRSSLNFNIKGVAEIAFSPDGQSLIARNRDGNIRVWDVDTANLLNSNDLSVRLEGASISSDSRNVLAWNHDDRIWLWALGKADPILDGAYVGNDISTINYSARHNILVTASERYGQIRVWPLDDGLQYAMRLNNKYSTNDFHTNFSEDGKQLFVYTKPRSEFHSWDISWLTGDHLRSVTINHLCSDILISPGLNLVDEGGTQMINGLGQPIKIGARFLDRKDITTIPSVKKNRGHDICDQH